MTRFNLYSAWFAIVISVLCYWKTSHHPYSAYFAEAVDVIHNRGLEEIDRQKLFEAAMSGMAEEHDQYSAFIPHHQRDDYINDLDQHLSGIGVAVESDPETKGIIVVNTVIGTPHPAHDAGMRSGDRIIAVEGESVVGKSLNEAVRQIRGPVGEPVSITVVHEHETTPVTVKVRRADITRDSVLGDVRKQDTRWDFRLAADQRIAYFRLTDFGDRTAEELKTALADLKKKGQLKAAIVDVRDNSGGYLTASKEVCDLFIDQGVIVTTRGRHGIIDRKYVATPKNSYCDIPMVVLVNHQSASASEIFAGCMQDHGRGTIIGTRSYGKGSVQQMIPMERNRSLLKLTTATYWRPSGKNIHRRKYDRLKDEWGVRPDEGMEVELDKEQDKKRRRLRQARDAFRPDRDPRTEDDPISGDPQLQKAVADLQSQLDKN